MDNYLRNGDALRARIDKLMVQCFQRFEGIAASTEIADTDYSNTAQQSYQIGIETAGLIRAVQDLMALTRAMQETWLFGQLDTLGTSKLETKTDEDAKAIAGLLAQLIKAKDAGNQQQSS